MSTEELKTELVNLRAQLTETRAKIAVSRARWRDEGISTPAAQRKELDQTAWDIAAEVRSAQIALLLRLREEVAQADMSWSDEMLAALTALVEHRGLHQLIAQARSMVAAGWKPINAGEGVIAR